MDFFDNRYYKISRLVLSVGGLWPYQRWLTRLLNTILIFTLFATTLCAMIYKMVTLDVTLFSAAYTLQYIMPATMTVMDLLYLFFNNKKMRLLLERTERDWSLFGPADTRIMKPYAEMARITTQLFTAVAVFIPFAHIMRMSTFNRREPGPNGTYRIEFPYPMRFPTFIDLETYYDSLIVVTSFVFAYTGVVLIGFRNMFVCSIHHACGMFRIVGHQLESMLDDLDENAFDDYDNDANIKLFRSIMFHKRAIKFAGEMIAFYGPLFIFEIGLCMILLSINILLIYQTITTKLVRDVMYAYLVNTFAVFLAIYYFSYVGQNLLNHSTDVLRTIYMSRWYVAPLCMQKTIVVIMMRSLKASRIALTTSIVASYEMLVTILQASMSYFMALKSLEES